MSRPWMPLYVADYLADTRRLTTLEHGVYMLLIMEYWQTGSLPNDDDALARIVGLPTKEWMKARKAVAALFQPEWKHKRIEAELQRSAEKSQSARSSAAQSWRSRRNANASANAKQSLSDGICEQHAHARDTQPQSQDRSLATANALSVSETDVSLVPAPSARTSEQRKKNVELMQAVVGLWHELPGPPFATVRDITDTRQASILARSRDLVKIHEFPDPLAGWRHLVELVRRSPWLRGENPTGWICDFDFILASKSFTKILELKYEAKPKPVRQFGRR
jgi:uncharacterized protein YdaU (DUF1376 family)